MISDKRLYLTANDEVVEDGHPDADTLLVCKGGTISDVKARRYGIHPDQTSGQSTGDPALEDGIEVDRAAQKAIKGPAETKAITGAPSDKAARVDAVEGRKLFQTQPADTVQGGGSAATLTDKDAPKAVPDQSGQPAPEAPESQS